MMRTFRSLICGAAGAVGTVAMDTLLYRRYPHSRGKSGFLAWESSEGVESWAHAPALVSKRLLENMLKREVSPGVCAALPRLGIYEEISNCELETLAKDLRGGSFSGRPPPPPSACGPARRPPINRTAISTT